MDEGIERKSDQGIEQDDSRGDGAIGQMQCT
jgi:hypothetical protein